jgi:hypothetical protein
VDASPGGGVIVAKGKNLLPEVKQELGFWWIAECAW